MAPSELLLDETAQAIHAAVLTLARRKVIERATAEDIAQETMARLLAALRTADIADPAAFAFRVAHNLVADFYRSRRVSEDVSVELPWDGPGPEAAFGARQELEAFQRLLNAMPERRRDIFLRRRLHGQSCQSIAADLGVSVKAVEKHISKALQAFAAAGTAER